MRQAKNDRPNAFENSAAVKMFLVSAILIALLLKRQNMVFERALMHDVPKERELFVFRKHSWVKVMPNELPSHIGANPTVEAYELRWHSRVLGRVISMTIVRTWYDIRGP